MTKIIVESAADLSPTQQTTLTAKLSKILGHPVRLKIIINSRLIGGLRISTESKIIDLTVSSKLNQLKENLLRNH